MARRFEFKLQKVLDYRQQLEEQARMELAQAQAEHDAQERLVEDILHKRTAHERKGFAKDATPADIWLWRQYLEALTRDYNQQRAELQRLALKLQNAMKVAVQRSKDRKLLEKLKEKQAKAHHEEESLRESKEAEEYSALRYEPADI